MGEAELRGTGSLAQRLAATNDIDLWIGISTVCEIFGVSRSTQRRYEAAGKVPKPVVREGNVKRWSLAECRAYQQARMRERGTDRADAEAA